MHTLIKEINLESSENHLKGRVIGLVEQENTSFPITNKAASQPGFILQDDSGRVFVASENFEDELPKVGDIVGVKVQKNSENGQEGVRAISNFEVLVECQDDFYIGPSSSNYKKIIVDLNLKEKLIQRTKILQWIREFFFKEGFIETDTPELVRLPGMEPYLDIFKTEFKPEFENVGHAMYLITSPEYAMKKLLVGGFQKIFQITKAFRNKETGGPMHNPEFTILEWYLAYADYKDLMNQTQSLIMYLFEKLYPGELFLQWGQNKVDISGNWKRLKVIEAFEIYAGISREVFENVVSLRGVARDKGYKVDENTSFDDIFFLIFLNEIEPKLGFESPVFLYEYPVSMAALSKVCKNNPKYAERFELYIAGIELCNAFNELNDAEEQAKRLEMERQERIKLGKDQYGVDQSFIDALKFGMPPSTGNALGVDRLIMLLTNTQNIRDILFFPHQDL